MDYLIETPLRADIALIYGSIVDECGNIFYNATTSNFNPIMVTAADTVICEAQKLVDIDELDPNCIVTQGIFVDFILGGDK